MRAPTLILCAVALVAAGCGDDEEKERERDRYAARYQPLSDRLVQISQGISNSLAGQEGAETLGVAFDLQITQLATVNRNIESLDTPEDLRHESGELTRRVREVVATLRRISRSVREGRDASPATVELATRAQAVNRARDALARAAGIPAR